jgi:hypothetical protein
MANFSINNVTEIQDKLDKCRNERDLLISSNMQFQVAIGMGVNAVVDNAALQIMQHRFDEQRAKIESLDDLEQEILAQQEAVLALRDACSLTLDVPLDVDNTIIQMPNGQPNFNEILKICRPHISAKMDFLSMLKKLFTYGRRNNFSHDTYKEMLAVILEGTHHTEFNKIRTKSLQEICDYFLTRYGIIDLPQHALQQCSDFVRLPGEHLMACMSRYAALEERKQLLLPPNARHTNLDAVLIAKLHQVLGPKTLDMLIQFQNVASANNHFIEYKDLLRYAFSAEMHNGERGPAFDPTKLYKMNAVELHNIIAQQYEGQDYQPYVQAVEMYKPKPPHQYRPNVHAAPQLPYNIPLTQQTRPLSRGQSPARPISPFQDMKEHIQDIITNINTQQNTTPKQPLSLEYKRPEMQQKAYNPSGTRLRVDPMPREFQTPGMLPTSRDFNQYIKNLVLQHLPTSTAMVPYQTNTRRDNTPNYQGNPNLSQQRWQSQSPNRYGNNQQPYQNGNNRSASGQWRDYGRQNNFRSGYSPARQQNDRGRSPARSQSNNTNRPPTPFYQQNGQNKSPNRGPYQNDRPGSNTRNNSSNMRRDQSVENIKGKHVPPDFSPTNDKHCQKCGGQNIDGRVLYHNYHADDKCHVYKFWNPDPCTTCKRAGFTAYHYEQACRRIPQPTPGN